MNTAAGGSRHTGPGISEAKGKAPAKTDRIARELGIMSDIFSPSELCDQ
jgi:hypothetical protein